MKPSERLDRGADWLKKHGWCRHSLWMKDGKRAGNRRAATHACLYGSMRSGPLDFAGHQVIDVLVRTLGVRCFGQTLEWNDRQKSKRPVVRAMRKAAELARSEGQ